MFYVDSSTYGGEPPTLDNHGVCFDATGYTIYDRNKQEVCGVLTLDDDQIRASISATTGIKECDVVYTIVEDTSEIS